MPNYLCMQRSLPKSDEGSGDGSDGGGGGKMSPTQMQEMYAKFGAWQEKYKDNLVDLGGRLGGGKLVTHDAQTDGPHVEVKELIGGYMVVSGETLEEAIEVASGCPGLVRPGSGVEVIEIRTQG